MKKNKIIKTILVLPLVVGLAFSWFFANPVSAQTASLVATVSINPLTLKLYAPTTVVQGDSFKLKAEIGNRGQSRLEKVKATVFPPSGLEVKGAEEKKVGVIKGGGKKVVSWRIKAVGEPKFYTIQVDVSGVVKETGDLVSISETTMVEVWASTSFWKRIIRRFLARASLLRLNIVS